MEYTAKNVSFKSLDEEKHEEKVDKLKFIERQFKKTLDDWHFCMVDHFDEMIKIFCWFGSARMVENKIYFDGKTTSGEIAFNFVKEKYGEQLAKSFGKIEIVLAREGVILDKYNLAMPDMIKS